MSYYAGGIYKDNNDTIRRTIYLTQTPTHQRPLATPYFSPSVGDQVGAKVASGLVCWS